MHGRAVLDAGDHAHAASMVTCSPSRTSPRSSAPPEASVTSRRTARLPRSTDSSLVCEPMNGRVHQETCSTRDAATRCRVSSETRSAGRPARVARSTSLEGMTRPSPARNDGCRSPSCPDGQASLGTGAIPKPLRTSSRVRRNTAGDYAGAWVSTTGYGLSARARWQGLDPRRCRWPPPRRRRPDVRVRAQHGR